MPATVKISIQVKAPIDEVYRSFTNATVFNEWLCDFATAIPRQGGRLYFYWNSGYFTAGEYLWVDPREGVEFTWHGREEPRTTRVKVSWTEQDDSTLVILEHRGLGNSPAWSKTRREIRTGWKNGLENLVSVLETGQDLRLINRPMLGFILGDFNPKIAEALRIPVNEGLRLDSVVEGMGAQAAGLQANDVLVTVNHKPLVDYGSLINAIQGKIAGDIVPVEYYRGGEKQQVSLRLSRRPIPEIPASPVDLAAVIEKGYQEIDAELDSILSGISEDMASIKPGKGEWGIKEILAHLIQSERGLQNNINEIICSQERVADGYSENSQAWINATVQTYPSLSALREELKRSKRETLLFIAAIPEAFTLHKGSYWRLAFNLLQFSLHFREHIQQISQVLDRVRVN